MRLNIKHLNTSRILITVFKILIAALKIQLQHLISKRVKALKTCDKIVFNLVFNF